MIPFKKFWHSLSNIGIDETLESHLRRKIVLTNQLAFTVTIIVSLAWTAMAIVFHGKSDLLLPIVAACTAYGLTIVFNALRWHTFSRIWFNLTPLIMILFFAGIITDGQVISMKIALLSVIIVPLVLFGIEERGMMVMGIVLVIAAYLGMDFVAPLIPNWVVVDMTIVDSPLAIDINGLLSFFLFIFAFTYFQNIANDAEQQLVYEKERSEQLLRNILPDEIADLLKDSPATIANHYAQASVLFADIVDFTPLSAELAPDEVVSLLNEVFSYFDMLAEKYDVEKIKTIGDCYMVAAGVPRPRSDHALILAQLALEAQDYFQAHPIAGHTLSFRIGINSGSLVAGVIGRKKFIYDLWGDAVNIASRMESHGVCGKVQITRATYELIQSEFICENGGSVAIKGKGEMEVWHVIGAR